MSRSLTLALIAVLALASAAFGQEVNTATFFAEILPNFHGQALQWGFNTGAGWLFPAKVRKSFKFPIAQNGVLLETVDGVSMVYAADSHDFCKAMTCSYIGTADAPVRLEREDLPDGSYVIAVTADFHGTYQDWQGRIFEDVPARMSFETYPSVDSVIVPGPGSFVVELQPN